MTADLWNEDARGLWQSQESVVTRMSADDMRARADRWNREFGRTNWIPFVCSGVLLSFFILMLVINQTVLQRAGALLGVGAAICVAIAGVRMASRRWIEDGATCVRAYKLQLQRRWEADVASARTIFMVMTGCALLSEPGQWVPWLLQAVTQFGTGVIVYVYITRQARRFRTRIAELTRLEEE
jgi:hypothetical protein